MKGRVLHAGTAQGALLKLDAPLSFWGAFDPRDGRILDIHHPQMGEIVKGKVLLLPETRGSGTAPGAIAEAIRLGTGPAAILLGAADMNLAIGANVAETLYGRACPVLELDALTYSQAAHAQALRVEADGTLTVLALQDL